MNQRDDPRSTRVVVLCCDGPYQRYLVKRLRERYRVTGVVLRHERRPKGALAQRLLRYLHPLRLGRYLLARHDLRRAAAAAGPLRERLFGPPGAHDDFVDGIETLVVENINDPEAVAFVDRHAPDIVCVNGTNLLREPMLALVPRLRLGIINLHTGLSPYTRGGNCNLYALLEGRPEWVGVTVHHIDAGIDSGDLILTGQVPMQPDDDYDMIDARTFHLGIKLLVQAVRLLAEGRAERVQQWTEGRLYLRRTGFVYDPFQRYRVNRKLASGLVRDYLADKATRDAGVRLVGQVDG
jgi:folate-dependent phosphoribosylglycinamide formyltransferase PurN